MSEASFSIGDQSQELDLAQREAIVYKMQVRHRLRQLRALPLQKQEVNSTRDLLGSKATNLQITLEATTWLRDSHGLFDYEENAKVIHSSHRSTGSCKSISCLFNVAQSSSREKETAS